MQSINSEYAFGCAKILQGENLISEETEDQVRFSKVYRKVIEQIINLQRTTIEVIDRWIWVAGNTGFVNTHLK